jgi:hypothetical protein
VSRHILPLSFLAVAELAGGAEAAPPPPPPAPPDGSLGLPEGGRRPRLDRAADAGSEPVPYRRQDPRTEADRARVLAAEAKRARRQVRNLRNHQAERDALVWRVHAVVVRQHRTAFENLAQGPDGGGR